MADKVNEVTERNTRFEVLIPEGMRAWMRSAARRRGLSESGLIKVLVYDELTRVYGSGWNQDHPEGDQDNVVGDQGA